MRQVDKARRVDVILQAAAKKGFTGRVRIKKVPLGEAPLIIRKAWVGLVLPCSPFMGFPENGEREEGVLSRREITFEDKKNGGKKAVYDGAVGLHNREGVSVPQKEALLILGLVNPSAEQFWRGHRFPKPSPDDCFSFGDDEVEIITGVKDQIHSEFSYDEEGSHTCVDCKSTQSF